MTAVVIAVTRSAVGDDCPACRQPIEPGRRAVLTRDDTGTHAWWHLRCLIAREQPLPRHDRQRR